MDYKGFESLRLRTQKQLHDSNVTQLFSFVSNHQYGSHSLLILIRASI